jgi:glyceraldehyde 3-phosphate dehydrogenase
MSKKIAINGFGRIGRLTLRFLLDKPDVEVVAINDLTDNATLAHLFEFDSAHGRFDGTVSHTEDSITINGKKIHAFSERNPEDLPWADHDIDLVLECTGIFRTKEKAGLHLKAGAKDVLISAPAKGGEVQTIVMGVNEHELDRRANVFSNASCTTNCLAPVAKIIDENWGIRVGSMTTIHAYTADQNIQDAPHKDLRRARAAAFNIVPTSTGAASAVGKVYPSVAGKLFAIAVRVPVITGSMIELNVALDKRTTAEEVNAKFKEEAEGKLKGVLEYADKPLVSSDIVRNPHSSIFDSMLTDVNEDMLKVVSWYDNEAGYSARMADLAHLILTK